MIRPNFIFGNLSQNSKLLENWEKDIWKNKKSRDQISISIILETKKRMCDLSLQLTLYIPNKQESFTVLSKLLETINTFKRVFPFSFFIYPISITRGANDAVDLNLWGTLLLSGRLKMGFPCHLFSYFFPLCAGF